MASANCTGAAAKRRVQFSSIPVATLFVDGKQIGPSIPAKTIELAEGSHRVRFEADGLETYQREFQVGPKETNRVAYQFPVGYLVIQADPPDEYKSYLHRAGRTGRAGKAGTVVTLVNSRRRRKMDDLLGRAEITPRFDHVRPGDELLEKLAAL